MDSHIAVIPNVYIGYYASSLARLRYLTQNFASGHPTYEAEASIFEINEAKLRSVILIKTKPENIKKLRPLLEKEVLKRVDAKVRNLIDDEKVIKKVIGSINSSDFDPLFNFAG